MWGYENVQWKISYLIGKIIFNDQINQVLLVYTVVTSSVFVVSPCIPGWLYTWATCLPFEYWEYSHVSLTADFKLIILIAPQNVNLDSVTQVSSLGMLIAVIPEHLSVSFALLSVGWSTVTVWVLKVERTSNNYISLSGKRGWWR